MIRSSLRNSLFLLPCLILTGCAFIGFKQQLKPLTDAVYLSGKVSGDSSDFKPTAVVICREDDGKKKLVQYKWLQKPGGFTFFLQPGTYYVGVFEDSNGNFKYDSGEPSSVLKNPDQIILAPRQNASDLNLTISRGKSDDLGEDHDLSLRVSDAGMTALQKRIGRVVSLDDPMFDDANGDLGLWKYDDFKKKGYGGLYFLEPYDPKKTPVLFIHGYVGTPRDFKYLVEHMDREKFQPWFVYYPSAMKIDVTANYVNFAVTHLKLTYSFKRMDVVGYSMGGLVSRAFILKNAPEQPENFIRSFTSIATPWNGHSLADFRNLAPAQAPSWEDLATGSPFTLSLFSRPFPPETKYYLFFGYKGDRNPFAKNNDAYVTLESALDPRAQSDAVKLYGFNEDHESIVDSKEVSDTLNKILAASV